MQTSGSFALLLAFAVLAACDSDAGAELTAVEERVSALEQKHPEGADPVTELQAQVDDLKKQLDQADKDLLTAAGKIEAAETTIRELQAATSELELRISKPGDDGGEKPPENEAKVGVPECDEYLAKYEKCIEDKIPEEARRTAIEALEKSAEAWREAAKTEAGREALASACKTAMEAVATSCGF